MAFQHGSFITLLTSFYRLSILLSLHNPIPIAPKKICLLVLPYLGPLSIYVNRKIKRLVNKFYPTIELRIVYKRGLSIQNLFSYEDQLPLKC